MSLTSHIPPALAPPVRVERPRAQEAIPDEGALPGGARYEPKWDGFRLVVLLDEPAVTLWSRAGRNLTAHFPDIVAALAEHVPRGTVLDGEVVIWTGGKLDFGALQRRLGTSARSAASLASHTPASYVAFDLLALAGTDLRPVPFDERRSQLEQLGGVWPPPLHVSPLTRDRSEAQSWLTDMAGAGIEGVVVKGGAQSYRPGGHSWVKVRQRDTLEVVAGAIVGHLSSPTAVVAGLPLSGQLRVVGRTTALSKPVARDLAAVIIGADSAHPWHKPAASAVVKEFGRAADLGNLTLIDPIVVEVSADVAWTGTSFRHPLRFVRFRPDLEPADVTVPAWLTK